METLYQKYKAKNNKIQDNVDPPFLTFMFYHRFQNYRESKSKLKFKVKVKNATRFSVSEKLFDARHFTVGR